MIPPVKYYILGGYPAGNKESCDGSGLDWASHEDEDLSTWFLLAFHYYYFWPEGKAAQPSNPGGPARDMGWEASRCAGASQ